MSLFGFKKKEKIHRTVPKTVQQSIPYERIFSDGTIETSKGVFTRAFWLYNLNFKNADTPKQMEIFHAYEDLLNAFPPSVKFQVVIQNYPADKRSLFESVRFRPAKDGRNRFRQERNNELLKIVTNGRKNVSQDKYIVVQVENDDIENAMNDLDNIGKILGRNLSRLSRDMAVKPLTAEERLRSLFLTYVQDGSTAFYNDVDENKKPVFDFSRIGKSGFTTKDIIGPSGMEFRTNSFKLGETWGCAMFLQDPGNLLSTDFLSELADSSCNLLLSIHHSPLDTGKAVQMMKRRMMDIDADIITRQKNASRDGYSADVLPPDLFEAKEETRALYKDVVGNDQKLFDITFTFCIFADSRQELDANVKMFKSIAENRLCRLKILTFQQEQGLNSSLPLCLNQLEVKRLYTTQSAAVFLPFTMIDLDQHEGFYYGTNQITNSPNFYTRLSGDNYNGLEFGSSGTGKSLFSKNEIISVLLSGGDGRQGGRKNRVYVIDPEAEYVALARAMRGEVIDLSPGSKTYMNPLDMDINYDEADPIGKKTDYIISLIEVMLGSGKTINPTARSIVARCVNRIYRPYLDHISALNRADPSVTCDKQAMPTLGSLYHELRRQEEPEAQSVASILEMYVNGSFETFAHKTSIETNTDFCVYNIKNLGTGSKTLGLYVCLNDILNRMFENYKQGYWTWFYIDEAYLCLQNETAADFLMEIWKRARKWRGVPTGIMQNPEDLLQSSQARRILANTSFVTLFSLSETDRMTIGELLKIPQEMLDYTKNAPRGGGLLHTNRTMVPFFYEVDLNTELGKIITTKATDDV